MTDECTYPEIFARLAQISAEHRTLHDEWDRICRAMRADGYARARKAMTEAGFVFGESIISCPRWNRQIGVLRNVVVEFPPHKSEDRWTFRVIYWPLLKSGKPGRRLDDVWESVMSPEDLPSLFKITGTAERQRRKVAGAIA